MVDWRLNLTGRGLASLEKSALAKCCRVAEHVDLSRNELQALDFLAGFDRMQTLTCDHNSLCTLTSLPLLKQLDTLSLNFNHLRDLESLEHVARNCPALTHLSLMGNPCCPLFSPATSEETYAAYREEVADYIPSLQLLDGSLIKKHLPGRLSAETKRRVSSLEECEIAEWPKA